MTVEFPCGALSLNSPIYIERPPIETLTYQEVEKSGSLVRIKAPRHMGKSSLLVRALAHGQHLGYKTIAIDFQLADPEVYTSLTKFLRWFCKTVSRELNLISRIENFWDPEIGAKLSCSSYFEHYLLAEIETPILLGLNEVNQVFEYPEIAKDFLPLLRYWHEQAKFSPNFAKLRMIVIHSTEVYIPLNVHQSPFNVGLPLKLSPFTLDQVKTLAQQYGLTQLQETEIQQLLTLVGGHPYLTSKAFYYLKRDNLTLAQLLKTAPSQAGIYSDYLRGIIIKFRKQPQLALAFAQVLSAKTAIELEPMHTHQLYSLGLVTQVGNRCLLACELYRQYFSQVSLKEMVQDGSEGLATVGSRLQQLEQENRQLKELVNIDALTRVANRRSFDQYLLTEWQRMMPLAAPLSLILLDIDCFKLYNDTYGHLAGDSCLRTVALTIRSCIRQSNHLVARYGGEEFAIVLPMTEMDEAEQVALLIQHSLHALKIEHVNSVVEAGIVTVSIGISTLVPGAQGQPQQLVSTADQALYAAKQQGRDRISLNRGLTAAVKPIF